MKKIIFGNTGLEITRIGFGALPIQRISLDESKRILVKAYESGINFFDTARAYSDSEEKIGNALSDVRNNIIIATKTQAKDAKTFWHDLQISLQKLKTDYIDIYQFHNPKEVPLKGDELYDAMLQAKQKGIIKHIGITNHSFENGRKAVLSGLYETLQYPFNHIASQDDLDLVLLCKDEGVGFIAMKALSGGLITNAENAFSYLWQYPHVVPIWGIQRIQELEQFIELEKNPPIIDEKRKKLIEDDKKELSGSFCRGCGYCMPCPVDIPISTAARMKFLLRRSPHQRYVEQDWQDKMETIENCLECNECSSRCPYHLNTPELLKEMLMDYREFVAQVNTK